MKHQLGTCQQAVELSWTDFFCDINTKTILTHQDVTYIFNGTTADLDLVEKQMIFTEDHIIYSDGKGNQMNSQGYEGFESFNTNSFNLLEDDARKEAFQTFALSVEASFSRYIVLYSVITNTMVNMFIQLAFILLLALVLQLFRIWLSTFYVLYRRRKVCDLIYGFADLNRTFRRIISTSIWQCILPIIHGLNGDDCDA